MWIKIFCLLFFILSECLTTKITRLEVPSELELGDKNIEELILDCEYELESDAGLVISWYLNDEKIYQWIMGRQPTIKENLGDHIETNYSLSEAPTEKYRAVRLHNINESFSGEYKCKVDNFVSNDVHQEKYLQFYDAGEGPVLSYSVDAANDTDDAADDVVLLECQVSGVYPQPVLTILLQEKVINQTQSNEVEEGRYNSTATASVAASSVPTGAELRCDLVLPRTTYNQSDVITFADTEALSETTEAPGDEGAPAAAVGAGSAWAAGGAAMSAAPTTALVLTLTGLVLAQFSSQSSLISL